MVKRILASIAMVILVFVASPQINDRIVVGKVQAQDPPSYIFYTFTQTIEERIIEPTTYYYGGCVFNKGERVPVGPMDDVPLSFNVTNVAAKNAVAASFGLTPFSTTAVCGVWSKENPNNAEMTVNYGFVCYQHCGYVTQYINGVAYHTYYDQFVNKALYIKLQYDDN